MGCGYKSLVFCRNNGGVIESMDKGLTVLKGVLIVRPKIPQQKIWIIMEKGFIGHPWFWQSWQDPSTIYALGTVNAG